MARFYGSIKGARGGATRLGHASSGLEVTAATWSGAVHVYAYDKDGHDMVRVCLTPWHGRGTSRVLYDGPASGAADTWTCRYCGAIGMEPVTGCCPANKKKSA